MRRAALVAVVAGAVLAAVFTFAPLAGAKRGNITWQYFHMHVNAYGGSGSCSAEWHDRVGHCDGKLEDASFLGYRYLNNGAKVHWGWQDNDLSLWWGDPHNYIRGTKPANWHTFTVVGGHLSGQSWVTGTTHAAGHQGGPLFVNLSSHGDLFTTGYSLDLRGYLRIK